MIKKSIIWRLFITISLLFIIFIAIGYAGQSLFLERFYIQHKVNTMKEELETLAKAYEKGEMDQSILEEKISTFYQKTNSQLAMLSQNLIWFYSNIYNFTVNVDGEEFTVSLKNILYNNNFEDLTILQLKKGNKVYIEGTIDGNNVNPSFIATNYGQWGSQINNRFINNVTGTILNVSIPNEHDVPVTTQVDMLSRAINQWISTTNSKDIPKFVSVFEYVDSTSGIKNKLFIRPINNGQDVLFSMTSLQSIGEAVDVVQRFYLYIMGVLLIFSGIFAFYLSKYLTSSFRKINRVTSKMAELDFSEVIEITSEDEIGNLSKNINLLSKNLKETIEQLQIANEKLQTDIEKERKLEKTRKEFISGVSHELKTPLSIIKSYSEAIKDGITKENTNYYVSIISQETEKMNDIIVDMLELAKLESGTYSIRKETFSIIELIDDINYKLMFTLQEKDMDIDVDTEDDYIVLSDKNRIGQVLTNFITNAVRYGTENTTILIRLSKENNLLRIAVENKGEQISEEQMEKIWERFYRIDAARTRCTGGTGLGLSIVKNILHLHKMEFGVYNSKDGVTFYFYLPLFSKDGEDSD